VSPLEWSTHKALKRAEKQPTEHSSAALCTGKYNLFLIPAKQLVYDQEQKTGLSLSEPEIAELLLTFACLRKIKEKKRGKKEKKKRRKKESYF